MNNENANIIFCIQILQKITIFPQKMLLRNKFVFQGLDCFLLTEEVKLWCVKLHTYINVLIRTEVLLL